MDPLSYLDSASSLVIDLCIPNVLGSHLSNLQCLPLIVTTLPFLSAVVIQRLDNILTKGTFKLYASKIALAASKSIPNCCASLAFPIP